MPLYFLNVLSKSKCVIGSTIPGITSRARSVIKSFRRNRILVFNVTSNYYSSSPLKASIIKEGSEKRESFLHWERSLKIALWGAQSKYLCPCIDPLPALQCSSSYKTIESFFTAFIFCMYLKYRYFKNIPIRCRQLMASMWHFDILRYLSILWLRNVVHLQLSLRPQSLFRDRYHFQKIALYPASEIQPKNYSIFLIYLNFRHL